MESDNVKAKNLRVATIQAEISYSGEGMPLIQLPIETALYNFLQELGDAEVMSITPCNRGIMVVWEEKE
jgi:hypothetical protein